MEALLTATEGRIRRAWLAMIAHLRDENGVDVIAQRLPVADPAVIVAGLPGAAASFAAGELAAYTVAGQAAAKALHAELNPVRKKLTVFDPTEPGAARWAAQNKLDTIREVTEGQRDAIREALVDGARNGTNPRETAVRIRGSIGLTGAQYRIVDNYRRQLEDGQYAAALQRELSSGHSDKAIAAAVRNRTSLTRAQIDTAVERYQSNFIAYRAEMIARTEGLRVAHQASDELYRQAIERGDLHADQLEGTWNHSPGARNRKNERPFHRSMHGQKRAWGEPFTSGLGGSLRFPGDPAAGAKETVGCRCAVSWRVKPGARAAETPVDVPIAPVLAAP